MQELRILILVILRTQKQKPHPYRPQAMNNNIVSCEILCWNRHYHSKIDYWEECLNCEGSRGGKRIVQHEHLLKARLLPTRRKQESGFSREGSQASEAVTGCIRQGCTHARCIEELVITALLSHSTKTVEGLIHNLDSDNFCTHWLSFSAATLNRLTSYDASQPKRLGF